MPVRVYGGQRIVHKQAPGSFAVSVHGMTAFPFAITDKIPRAEPYKILPRSRVLPAAAARAQADPPGGRPTPEQ